MMLTNEVVENVSRMDPTTLGGLVLAIVVVVLALVWIRVRNK